ncbi:MAG: hypothetical protein ABWY25_00450 [Paenisporosarcina sp.]
MAKMKAIVGDIIHAVGVRYRVRGDGLLETRLKNLDGLRTEVLNDIEMEDRSRREMTSIANFQDQGVQILFRTIFIDEIFSISKIVCFVKPVAESYPQRSGG